MKKLFLFVALLFSIKAYAVDFETEPNNVIEEADPIFPGIPLRANIFDSEEDWYFIETTGSDVLTLSLDLRMNVKIYDNNDNELYDKIVDEEPVQIGLGSAGKYFLKIYPVQTRGDYEINLNLENRSPHSDLITNCPGHSRFNDRTGILDLPVIEYTNALGVTVNYEATLQFTPINDKINFKLIEASPL